MKRKQLARDLARATHLSAAAAQDRVDELVHEILRRLRSGEPVDLPGLGIPSIAARAVNGKVGTGSAK
jgi:nucleoid DNA-binding protein